MVILGFPSIGLVSLIAANFVVRNMELERVASIISDDFPPYTLIHDGVPSPPIRIFAGQRECDDTGEQCEQLIVINGEFIPKGQVVRPTVEKILDWCEEKGVRTIVTLEGINVNQDSDEAEVMGVASNEKTREMLNKYNVKELREGMVSGISGVMLYEAGIRGGCDIVTLLGPAKSNYPDARGAARLLEVVGEMLPELKLDPEPLYEEAGEIEERMKKAMESIQRPEKPEPVSEQSILYG